MMVKVLLGKIEMKIWVSEESEFEDKSDDEGNI